MIAKASGSFCSGGANVHMITPYTMNGHIRWDTESYSSRSTSLQVLERLRMASPLTNE